MNVLPHLVRSIVLAAALAPTVRAATIFSYSFWAYDQYPGNSPYYSHYQVARSGNLGITVASIGLYDGGWPTTTTGNSDSHVMTFLNGTDANSGTLRSVGWHYFEMTFNEATQIANLRMDGNTLRTGVYTGTPAAFGFVLHDYYGGTQETVIDDFQFRIDGNLVYEQDFESATLDSNWSIARLDAGTYIASGDTSNPRTGNGALAIGATTGGNLAASISFVAIPEPSLGWSIGLASLMFAFRRRR